MPREGSSAIRRDGLRGTSVSQRRASAGTHDHVGEGFKVRGLSNVARYPRAYPRLVQARSAEAGKGFAARYAEAVFTAQQNLDEGKAFSAEPEDRVWRAGRDPESVKILPGIVPVVGDGEPESRKPDAELDRLVVAGYAKTHLAERFTLESDELDSDAELPQNVPTQDKIEAANIRFTVIVHNLVRHLIGRVGGGRRHRTFARTPPQVADAIAHRFSGDGVDFTISVVFTIMAAVPPAGPESFVDDVVSIPRARGRFRTEYTDTTSRENDDPPRPVSRFAPARRVSA